MMNQLIIATMLALQSLHYTPGNEMAYLQGYNQPADGGQGVFRWEPTNTAVPDSGIIIPVRGVTTGRWVREFSGPVNARWFGATGNGATDDRPSLSHALASALADGHDLFLPSGTYRLGTYSDARQTKMLIAANYTGKSQQIRIYGEQQTRITTDLYKGTGGYNSMIYFENAFENCVIEHIFFENTHGLPPPVPPSIKNAIGQTNAIGGTGTPGLNNRNFKIRDCVFEGFSTAISVTGTIGTQILDCTFNAPKGRDNAQGTDTSPAVFVWLQSRPNTAPAGSPDNSTPVIDPIVTGCQVNGYTGSLPISDNRLFSHAPMDGFVYGNPVGGIIAHNTVKNCGAELLDVAAYVEGPGQLPDERPVLITDNLLDCSQPRGSADAGHRYQLSGGNYGIRSEAGSSVISGNVIYNATIGIIQSAHGIPADAYVFKRWKITGNTVYISTDTAMHANYGIGIQGHDEEQLRAQDAVITDNTVVLDGVTLRRDFHAFSIAHSNRTTCANNILVVNQTEKAGYGMYFCYLPFSTGAYFRNNTINGPVDGKIHVLGNSTYTDADGK
jgi:hypothetical protein